MSDRTREQIDLLYQELEDVDAQVVDGDLDEETADEIRSRYKAELAALEASAAASAAAVDDDADEGPEKASGIRRLNGRALAGIALVTVAMTVIGVFAVQSINNQRITGADGIVGDVVRGEDQINLDDISNEEMEQIVAANPDIVPMRLALARRYFEDGDFDMALEHYFEVLDREQSAEALANVGWMTFLSNRPDIAVTYVETALDREPGYIAAEWYLGNIYIALGRNGEATVLLTKIVASDQVPQDVKDTAISLLEQIRGDG